MKSKLLQGLCKYNRKVKVYVKTKQNHLSFHDFSLGKIISSWNRVHAMGEKTGKTRQNNFLKVGMGFHAIDKTKQLSYA